MSAEKTAAEKTAVTSTPDTQAIDASTRAEANSAHSRINVPLNLDNWKRLTEDLQRELLWFHQHTLDERLNWQDVCDALNYDRSTVFRILKGTYEGSWPNVLKSIRGYRRLTEKRGTIQRNEYVQNGITQIIHAGLDYAIASNTITTIIGESRMGKTVAAKMWKTMNNAQAVYVSAPAIGGSRVLLRWIGAAVGFTNDSLPAASLLATISRSFNKNRILIIDEAHRLLPSTPGAKPTCLEIIRDLYNDGAGCSVAMIATSRFDDAMSKTLYMYEQVLGRIGMPIRLPRRLKKSDYMPILRQYVRDPGEKLLAACDDIANNMGRLGILVETLKLASRIARKSGGEITDDHVFKSIALRRQMMGEQK